MLRRLLPLAQQQQHQLQNKLRSVHVLRGAPAQPQSRVQLITGLACAHNILSAKLALACKQPCNS
jgi:hypothetical protein